MLVLVLVLVLMLVLVAPRSVLDAVTLALAPVLFPRLARRPAFVARRVVARVRTFRALRACRSAAIALELPRCAREERVRTAEACTENAAAELTPAEVARYRNLFGALPLGSCGREQPRVSKRSWQAHPHTAVTRTSTSAVSPSGLSTRRKKSGGD